jgi:hypothetical protein
MIFIFQLTCDLPISPDRRIYGSWNWVITGGMGCGSAPLSPILVNYSTNDIVSVYRNNSLLYTGGFKLEYEEFHGPYPRPPNIIDVINLPPVDDILFGGSLIMSGRYEIHDDTLYIVSDGGLMSSCASTYTNKKQIHGLDKIPQAIKH